MDGSQSALGDAMNMKRTTVVLRAIAAIIVIAVLAILANHFAGILADRTESYLFDKEAETSLALPDGEVPAEETKEKVSEEALKKTLEPVKRVVQVPDWEIPKHLFHFGQQKYLLEDAQIDSIPQEAWDKYVMGDSTSNQLPHARRGLYGGININYISHFGPDCGAGKTPWFMVIHVDDQCRGSEVVGDFRDIPNSSEFKTWFENTWVPNNPGTPLDSIDAFLKSAVDFKRETGMFRIRYHQRHRIRGENANTALHEEILKAWIEYKNFKIMFNDLGKNDTSQDSQWYIRDINCIEKIDGTPDEVLGWISQRTDFWRNHRSYGNRPQMKDFDSPVITLLKALADLGPLDSGHVAALDRIKTVINSSNTPIEEELSVSLTDLLTEISKCEGKAELSEIFQLEIDHYMNSCGPQLDLYRLKNKVRIFCQ